MKLKKIILSLFASVFMVTDVFAWGQVGHDTTCRIAELHLTKKAKKRINQILEGKSIVYWSNWLDNASHQPQYAYSLTWHYKNVDAGLRYEDVPPVEEGDIVTALTDLQAKLQSHKLSHDEEALALKMFIHLLGDLHQPMHLGHKSDLGANQVNVLFFGQEVNLHQVWDGDLVDSGHRWTYDEWTSQIDRASKAEQQTIVQGTFDDWARETLSYATQVYASTPDGAELSYDYVAQWTPIVEQQFLKGGLRLAHLLNEIYK